MLLAGRPFTGERATIAGINYPAEDRCFWTRHCRAIWRHYQANPNGPHSFGWWDSVPGRPDARTVHAAWLKQYLPIVEEGTWAWLEIGESTLFTERLPATAIASAFANRDLYLVLANYSRAAVRVATDRPFAPCGRPGGTAKSWELAARSLLILKRAADGASA